MLLRATISTIRKYQQASRQDFKIDNNLLYCLIKVNNVFKISANEGCKYQQYILEHSSTIASVITLTIAINNNKSFHQ